MKRDGEGIAGYLPGGGHRYPEWRPYVRDRSSARRERDIAEQLDALRARLRAQAAAAGNWQPAGAFIEAAEAIAEAREHLRAAEIAGIAVTAATDQARAATRDAIAAADAILTEFPAPAGPSAGDRRPDTTGAGPARRCGGCGYLETAPGHFAACGRPGQAPPGKERRRA